MRATTNTLTHISAFERRLIVTPSPELHLKSRRSRKRLLQTLANRLATAAGTGAHVSRGPGDRFTVTVDHPDHVDAVATRLSSVFGVGRADEAVSVSAQPLSRLVSDVTALAAPWVENHTFGVRVRRRGERLDWSAPDAERSIGTALCESAPSARVDLTNPQVPVRVEVIDGHAWLSVARHEAPRGLPLGSASPMLALLSGGIDSPVAAWLMMRVGSPVHFVHFSLGCSGVDHAAAVASEMVQRYGFGTSPQLIVAPFEAVADALVEKADPALRQIHLKQAMLAAAQDIAGRCGMEILVTGDSVGQVSSQTAANLAVINRSTDLLVMRPLAGMTKEEISARARAIGTYEISTRAVERCDLSSGPVAIEARFERVEAGWKLFDRSLIDRAVADARRIDLLHWLPGEQGRPAWDTPARRVG